MSLGLSPLGLTPLGLAPAATSGGGSGGVTTTNVTPGAGALTFTGYAPSVAQSANQSVIPGAGTLAITGYAPSVSQSTTTDVDPQTGTLTFTGYAPTVTRSVNTAINPDVGALSFSGYAPTVAQTANNSVVPGVASLALTGYAPMVAQTGNQALVPGAATLSLTGYAPSVAQAMMTADPRYARPIGDVSDGTWAPSSGSSLSTMIGEQVADDSTYISTTNASICRIQLAPVAAPGPGSSPTMRYRAGSASSNGLYVRLYQGNTLIAQWTHNPLPSTLTTFAQALSNSQMTSITDYTNLFLEFEAF